MSEWYVLESVGWDKTRGYEIDALRKRVYGYQTREAAPQTNTPTELSSSSSWSILSIVALMKLLYPPPNARGLTPLVGLIIALAPAEPYVASSAPEASENLLECSMAW